MKKINTEYYQDLREKTIELNLNTEINRWVFVLYPLNIKYIGINKNKINNFELVIIQHELVSAS